MAFDVIVLLGAPNDPKGHLSQIGASRLRAALDEYRRRRQECRLLATGGFGEHFNTTTIPHARYVLDHLLVAGVRPADLLGIVESSSTLEDASLSRRFLDRSEVDQIVIVTSDFHLQRARLVFEHYYPKKGLAFIGASAALTADERARLFDHERQAIAELARHGIKS